jgi:hypothetical protein
MEAAGSPRWLPEPAILIHSGQASTDSAPRKHENTVIMLHLQPDLVVYEFSRQKIEKFDFEHFLRLYGKPPTGQALRDLMNRFLFCIQGYDDDSREIYFIPEVRRFYRAFHAAWPFCLFHLNLDQDGLRSMVLCCLDSLMSMRRRSTGRSERQRTARARHRSRVWSFFS